MIKILHEKKFIIENEEKNNCIIIENNMQGEPLISLFKWGHGTELKTEINTQSKYEILEEAIRKINTIN